MAPARMPDAFFDLAAHHLPPEQPIGPEGGRPPVSRQVVMTVLWFVLATGCRWEDVPPELGCSGMAAHRYLRRWEELGSQGEVFSARPPEVLGATAFTS